jgi:hypothetical protein
MAVYAFVGGVSVADEDTMNALIAMQDAKYIYTGTSRGSYSGAGVTENSGASYSYAIGFKITGATTLGYLTLNVDADGTGQDLTVQIRDGLATSGTSDGTLIAQAIYPKEFMTASAASTIYIPFGISGLTAAATYYFKTTMVGDATDKFDLIGEASANTANQTYRRVGDSGAWSASTGIHYEVFDWTPISDSDCLMTIYGGYAVEWQTLTVDGLISNIKYYIPGIDGSAGLRQTYTPTYSGEYIISEVIT